MESANIHHHLQQQLVGSSSSSTSLATPSSYGVIGTATHHPNWTPIPILNTNGFTSYPNEPILSSRDSRHQHQQDHSSTTSLLSSHYSSNNMAPDLAFHWANSTNFTSHNIQSAHDEALQLSRIKEEFSDNYYLKYTELLNNSNSRSNSSPSNDVGTKLLLKPASSGNLTNKNVNQLSPGNHLYDYGAPNNISGRGFSQIFPSINVSSLNQTGFSNPGSLDMNLEALDLLASSRFAGNFGPSPHNQLGLLRDELSTYGFDQMQQAHSSDKMSSTSSNGVAAEAKRASRKMEPKAPTHQNAPKKSRFEARASCPPFKVRKEKLGDRIATLQQLVAPFGKTDTASVLMEAIGYIKFLQNQVETLSVPYMKTSRNKPSSRVIKGGPTDYENEEPRRDLKSRGLCLVPLTCLSYITDGGGPAVWPPPHFGGTI